MLALKPWIDLELPESIDTALTDVCFFSSRLIHCLCQFGRSEHKSVGSSGAR